MEKKDDSNSPVGVLEDYFRSEDSETCSSKEPSTDSDSKPNTKLSSSLWHGIADMFRAKTKKPLATLYPLSILKLSTKRSNSMKDMSFMMNSSSYNKSSNSQSHQKIFSLHELQSATNNFCFGKQLN